MFEKETVLLNYEVIVDMIFFLFDLGGGKWELGKINDILVFGNRL
jgi:hypothetical protein